MTARLARLWLATGWYAYAAVLVALTAWMGADDRSRAAVACCASLAGAASMFALCASHIRAQADALRERDAEVEWFCSREQRAAENVEAVMNAKPTRGNAYVN